MTFTYVNPEGALSRYLQEIRKFPTLAPDEELELSRRWRDYEDMGAAHQLVTSHLRLVAKIARGYRGYGLPVGELISEGNIGMMQAVKRFDPDRGFRLATYAMWWIRAAIQEYILHSWSLVKMGTTAAQKKLFFNLRRLKGQTQAIEDGGLHPEQVVKIARMLAVPEQDVVSMNRRLARPDVSLNAPVRADSEGEWQDWLVDESDSQEAALADRQELSGRKALLSGALKTLNERERHILIERRLKDNPTTLEDLSQQYGISRERVRQIEVRAFGKVHRAITSRIFDKGEPTDGLRDRRSTDNDAVIQLGRVVLPSDHRMWLGRWRDIDRWRGQQDRASDLQDVLSMVGAEIRPEEFHSISRIRPYTEPLRGSGKRQDILEVFVGPDPGLRNRLHGLRKRWHDATGWYVVVRGEYLGSAAQGRQVLRWLSQDPGAAVKLLKGRLAEVATAAGSGQCIRLRLTDGRSALLDLGGSGSEQLSFEWSDQIAFLSHAHPDHTGGLRRALARGLHVFASEAAIRTLFAEEKLEGLLDAELACLHAVVPGAILTDGSSSLAVACHSVPHSIGSVAWTFSDGRSSLLYTGDIMLRSRSYGFDWLPHLEHVLHSLPGTKTVLLEAARAHAPGSVADEVTWDDAASMPQDVVVVGDNPERLLNGYAQLYKARKSLLRGAHPACFVMTGKARPLLEACWSLIHSAGNDNADTFFLKPGGHWGAPESRDLYWLDGVDVGCIKALPCQRFWFVYCDKRSPADGDLQCLPPFADAVVLDMRTGNNSPTLPGLSVFPYKYLADRPAWTQHSHGCDLADAVHSFQALGARVFLFHVRTPKHHAAFQERFKLDVPVVSRTRIEFAGHG